MRQRLLVLVAVSLALVALMGGVAFADTAADNAQCLTCHGPGTPSTAAEVDFGVGTVDRATACNKCHWITNHPYHFAESECGGTCHKAWVKPPRTTFYQSVVAVGSSYFTTAASYNASAETLHAIHTKRTWIAEATEYRPACATCHAAASCEACHSSTVAHGQHGVAGDPAVGDPTVPVMTSTAPGVAPGTNDLINRSVNAENACAAAACHGAPEAHDRVDDVDPAVTYTGTWTTVVNAGYLGGSLTSTTAAGASFETTFEGTGFAWIGGREFNGGIAAVYVDNVQVATVDTYNTPWGFGRTVYWTGGLPAGSHTLKVVNTGTKNPSSSGTKISIQQLDFRAEGSFQPVPSCSSCHFTFAEHYDATAHTSTTLVGCSGEGCHSTPDLLSVHTQRNAAFGCGGCHDSVRAEVQNSITEGLTGCSDCHGSISALTGHRDAHAALPPLANANGTPNYSYYTGSVGTAPTGDCKGCHTSNLVDEHLGLYLSGWVTFPRYDSSGAALTCGTCHDQPAGSTVQNAIAASKSACESCHTVHGPMQDVHSSTFVDGATIPCADCHSANLVVEHDGGYTSTAGLTSCDVCHELYDGMTSGAVTGSATQSAISGTNDTRCSACHTAYHTNTAVHEATTVASKACAVCHTEGGTSVIDVTAIHADAALGACKVCHANTARVPNISTKTAECSSCHVALGTDYHRNMAVHTAPESGCSVAGCHHSNRDVTVVHEAGCTTCHDGSALPATTACDNCHVTVVEDYHYNFDVDHTPTDAYSTGCAECHDTTDVRSLHVTKSCDQCHFINGCGDCHAVHMGGVGLVKSTSCSTCHDVEGAGGNYHTAIDASHTFSAMNATCLGCHPNTLPEAHAEFLSRYPAYDSTCDLCHKNADPSRIDWATASADCSSCHEIHGDIAVVHTATSSKACVDCHESADVRTLHAATPDASCDVCHNAPAGRIDWTTATVECTSCHGTLAPVDPKHYPAAAHLATTETGCTLCHSVDMKTEHFKSTVAVSCVACHELKVDAFTAPWDKTCTACHPTKHANQAVAHKSTNTTCTGTGCHVVTDVSVLHGTNCAACHAVGVTASTNCTLCHPGSNPHHVTITLKSTTDSGWRTMCGSCHGRTHSMSGCSRCHAPSRLHNVSRHVDQNSRCAGCHKVATADAAKNCLACHASVQGGSSGGSWGGGSWGGR